MSSGIFIKEILSGTVYEVDGIDKDKGGFLVRQSNTFKRKFIPYYQCELLQGHQRVKAFLQI